MIDRVTLAIVTEVPQWHPEHATFEPFPVHAWVVRHPDGVLLVDTGIGIGNPFIDELYRPSITPLADALATLELSTSDITAVVLSHLHFDHCGQQNALSAPVYVQADEHTAARSPGYTVPEWADISKDRLRLVHGDNEIAHGVRLVSTPGHTPGHQSVLIEAADQRVMLAAQCAYRVDELRSGEPSVTNLHDDTWAEAARDSLQRVRALAPVAAQLSHDPEVAIIER